MRLKDEITTYLRKSRIIFFENQNQKCDVTGVTEITGMIPDKFWNFRGHLFAIHPNDGKPIDEYMIHFMEMVNDNGGIAFEAKSLEDVYFNFEMLAFYNKYMHTKQGQTSNLLLEIFDRYVVKEYRSSSFGVKGKEPLLTDDDLKGVIVELARNVICCREYLNEYTYKKFLKCGIETDVKRAYQYFFDTYREHIKLAIDKYIINRGSE